MRELNVERIQTDEIWCYVAKKQKQLEPRERRNPFLGDQYIFVGIDAHTKLVPAYAIGKRDSATSYLFVKELALRIRNRFQLSTDAFKGYFDAVDRLFGAEIDYGQIHKTYGQEPEGEKRYSPARIISIEEENLNRFSELDTVSTSYVERQNLYGRGNYKNYLGLVRFT